MSCFLVQSPNASATPDLTGNRSGTDFGYFTNDSACGAGDGTSIDAADLNKIIFALNGLMDAADIDCSTVTPGQEIADAIDALFQQFLCLDMLQKGGQSFNATCGAGAPSGGNAGDFYLDTNAAGTDIDAVFLNDGAAWADVTADVGDNTCFNCAGGDTWCWDGTAWAMGSGSGAFPPNTFTSSGDKGSTSSAVAVGDFGDSFPHTVAKDGLAILNVASSLQGGGQNSGDSQFATATVAVVAGDVIDTTPSGNGISITVNGTAAATAQAMSGGGTSTDQQLPHPGQVFLIDLVCDPPKIGPLIETGNNGNGASFTVYCPA